MRHCRAYHFPVLCEHRWLVQHFSASLQPQIHHLGHVDQFLLIYGLNCPVLRSLELNLVCDSAPLCSLFERNYHWFVSQNLHGLEPIASSDCLCHADSGRMIPAVHSHAQNVILVALIF